MESHAVDSQMVQAVLSEAVGSMTIILICQVILIAPRANSYDLPLLTCILKTKPWRDGVEESSEQ